MLWILLEKFAKQLWKMGKKSEIWSFLNQNQIFDENWSETNQVNTGFSIEVRSKIKNYGRMNHNETRSWTPYWHNDGQLRPFSEATPQHFCRAINKVCGRRIGLTSAFLSLIKTIYHASAEVSQNCMDTIDACVIGSNSLHNSHWKSSLHGVEILDPCALFYFRSNSKTSYSYEFFIFDQI